MFLRNHFDTVKWALNRTLFNPLVYHEFSMTTVNIHTV